jgi:hypothetical protein
LDVEIDIIKHEQSDGQGVDIAQVLETVIHTVFNEAKPVTMLRHSEVKFT